MWFQRICIPTPRRVIGCSKGMGCLKGQCKNETNSRGIERRDLVKSKKPFVRGVEMFFLSMLHSIMLLVCSWVSVIHLNDHADRERLYLQTLWFIVTIVKWIYSTSLMLLRITWDIVPFRNKSEAKSSEDENMKRTVTVTNSIPWLSKISSVYHR